MPKPPSARLVENLRLLLVKKRANQADIATALHKSQAWVSQLLNGERDTPTHNVEAIARALHVPIEKLWLPNAGMGAPPEKVVALLPPLVQTLFERCEHVNDDGLRRLIEDAELMGESDRYGKRRVKRGGARLT